MHHFHLVQLATAAPAAPAASVMDYYVARVGWWQDGSVMVQVSTCFLWCMGCRLHFYVFICIFMYTDGGDNYMVSPVRLWSTSWV